MRELLTNRDAARRLGVTSKTALAHHRRGRLRPVARTPMGIWLYDPQHVRALAAQLREDRAP
jgi:DNA-binding transcriptional MerR regulator